METGYRNLHMKFDEDYKRMQFFSASEENIPEDVLAGLKFGPLNCKPRFILYVDGQKVDEVDGADYPKLEVSIGKNVPALDD